MKTNATAICPKCNGARKLPHYASIANGDCFECGATGRVSIVSRKGTARQSAPAAPPSADYIVSQMRVWYMCAREQGAAWFADEGESGVGMDSLRWNMQWVDADTAARIIAAFEALEAQLA
jgi:hypothetical protein